MVRALTLLMALCIPGCGRQPQEYWTGLGSGCMHVVDHHRTHGFIGDVTYLDGISKRYYPTTDQTWCDRIAVSGDYVFGETITYDGDSVRNPATVIHYFAFCTVDKSVKEFRQMKELSEFAKTVGVEKIPPFTSITSESKPLY